MTGSGRGTRRVRRARPTAESSATRRDADFACAYSVPIAPDDGRSAEQWARAIWEGAPALLRWFMLAGWRFVLGLRIGPRNSPDHILGWRITETTGEETLCQLESGFLKADNVFRKVGTTFVWSTFVTYSRPFARFVWRPVSLLHRVLVRISLRRAAAPSLRSGQGDDARKGAAPPGDVIDELDVVHGEAVGGF